MKKFRKRLFNSIFLVLLPMIEVAAQSNEKITMYDSTFILSEIEVNNSRLSNYALANSTDSVSVDIAQGLSLVEQLALKTSIYVRSYGLGSLATTSLRGGSSAHTAVLWNGVNLQSPMNGVVDLALLPAFFTDSVYVQYGGNSALWGSGAMGGTIYLANKKPEIGLKGNIWGEAGSFGQYQQGISLSLANQKQHSQLKLWNQSAENDFTFNNRAQFNNPEQRQVNAALSIQGATFEHNITSKLGGFRLSAWWQQSDREIPASMTVNESVATQEDESIRFSLQWSKSIQNHLISIRTAFLDDELLFEDAAIDLESKSQSNQVNSEVKYETVLKNRIQFLSGVQHIYERAKTVNYDLDIPTRNRISFASSLKWNNRANNFTLLASGRQEWNSVTGVVPFIPSLGAIWQINSILQLRGSVNRSYRLPTFNDLFWQPGGNPDLKAEIGWAEELTTTFNFKDGKAQLEAVVFNKNLENQIVWRPTERGYWAPFNVQNVWIRGLEFTGKYMFQLNQFKIEGTAIYQYLKVTNSANETENIAPLYSPENLVRLNINLNYKKINVGYLHQFTGKQFITTDFSRELPHYQTASLNLNTKVNYNNLSGQLWFAINNLWDEQYEVIAWRPMPGRNFKTGINLTFQHKNK